ncbi:Carboxypeptidase A2 [Trichinella pseudospiralis]|uniref:Carboxypeptidase A2 n=1 Tax=Trichinella pseudospiralis TaxID=6337 RepID=A0A0V1DZ84_TRIPS|nr:Carboxypeptidase A2 [Trichinella pseudospiralis]
MFAKLSLFWTIIFASIFSVQNLNLYENYQLLQIQLLSQDDVNVLQKIVDEVENLEIDFWTPLTDFDNYDKPIIAFVPPTSANLLIESLEKSNISYNNITDVFRKHFNNHVQMLKDKKHKMKTSKLSSTFTLNEYHTLAEIHWYMQTLSRKHPQIVKLINIGYSTEGRPLLAVKVGRNSTKNSIWIDAGMHAREWIAPATAVYLLHQLAENYKNTKEIQSILDKYNFYILPVVNPDGYDYSWKSERFWRKSRSKHNCTFWSCCVGVDLDRCNLGFILEFSIGQEMDWIRLFTNISLAYSIKLPPTPNEPYGFLLPEDYIVPVSIQAFEGILNMVKSLNYFY